MKIDGKRTYEMFHGFKCVGIVLLCGIVVVYVRLILNHNLVDEIRIAIFHLNTAEAMKQMNKCKTL